MICKANCKKMNSAPSTPPRSAVEKSCPSVERKVLKRKHNQETFGFQTPIKPLSSRLKETICPPAPRRKVKVQRISQLSSMRRALFSEEFENDDFEIVASSLGDEFDIEYLIDIFDFNSGINQAFLKELIESFPDLYNE